MPLDQEFDDILNNMGDERAARESIVKDIHIKWSSLTQSQVIQELEGKGYQVNSLGNNKYEISRQFQPVKNINKSFQIKMIFNAKDGISESSTLYHDGKKVSESKIEFVNNKKIVHKKFYSINSTRVNKDLIIKKEY